MVFPVSNLTCWWDENLLLAARFSLGSGHFCQAWQQAAFTALVGEQVAHGPWVWRIGHVFHDPVWVGICSAVCELLEGDMLGNDFVEEVDGYLDDFPFVEPDWNAVLIEEVDVFS